MAWIKTRDTATRHRGKPVKAYVVIWKETERDDYGLPIPVDPAKPNGRKKTANRQETFPTRELAEARRDELNAARHTNGTSALADQKVAGDLPFGHYAQAWIESQALKVAQGRLKQRTLDDYEKVLRRYALDHFGGRAVASITPRDCELFLAGLVGQQSRQNGGEPIKPATVKHAWGTFRRVMRYALQQGALTANPCDRVDFATNRATGDHDKFEHHPLTAAQVAKLSAAVGGELDGKPSAELPAYPVYALMVDFLAYSGLRSAENAGLEVGDLLFTTRPGSDSTPTVQCAVRVQRTKERKGGAWTTSTPKSRKSRRSVPLPGWLAERMHAYLRNVHPRADEPTAPLWPSRKNGGGHRAAGERYAVPLDWSQPLAMGTFYDTILKPALLAVGLPASQPAKPATKTRPAEPAHQGVRLHDLRHTFATMQLMAGVHFMQVSKWLGHGTFTLTLDTYGDWIPEEDGGALNNLPAPVSIAQLAEAADLAPVIQLFGP
ncbi:MULTISPECIES: tyrosine-type recombinase/integrase [Tsukamurella]|uniref:Site-specific tyrosine recombinase XerC n=3 Tax=Tsukamurella TaxID=2060 RepID=A0A3P8MC32_TSUPA|nr:MULTISPECIES: tyrosine-type recombinase/integrase [Tsukamurella]NMD57597.1 tyrosine-type recombinase/integrase [Tsukamurella columbiensis]TWS29001.1 tyrosine-type recombinase/integrase [Tsukamurella conjunctivitidis]UEA84790.1 site-specific integrase [Tsukamurella paurometabola]VDR37373.1 site-specific tyrosine recombinase XerC [Tsukamurella paurometabola]